MAHRVGLIPIKADPRLFKYHEKKEVDDGSGENQYNDEDSIKFKLHIRCTKKDSNAPSIINESHDEGKLYNNSNVLSGDLQWEPIGK